MECFKCKALILVLMEDTLGALNDFYLIYADCAVLILVLMEDTLGVEGYYVRYSDDMLS